MVTALIFVVLTFGKLLQQSLAEQARAAEITAKSVESALRKSEERYRTVFQHTVDAISISRVDDGSYLEVNSAFVDMLGYEPGEIVGKPAATLKIWAYPEELKRLLDLLAVHGEVMNFEARFWRKNGDLVWGVMSSRVIDIDGVRCRVAVTRDVTEQKKADELINFLAYFDPLTRLPNRTLLLDRLHQTMDANARSGVFGALLLIDLDDFRSLNDTRGHDCGDLLLKQVAERLPGCVQPGDTVARLGGDEFLVMLVALGRREQEAATLAEMTAEKIASVLSQEFPLIAENHRCTASIGVCLFKGAETDSEALLKQVELAMYRAKGVGRNLIRFFDPDMEVAIAKRAALEKDLRNALLGKQFVVHYQVQVTGERIVGVEALVRWQHPLRGMVSPGEFIELAEETGLIVPLGLWVLERACTQLAQWAANPRFAHFTIAVNVSVQQFNQADFVEQILAILHETGANPAQLKLELTESLLVSNVDAIIGKMFVLKAQGIHFSLDDFGTGYSSLSYLKRLPIDQLKIDQTFVRDLLVNPGDISIAKTIIELGGNLGIDVIAEGVETVEHRAFLAGLGCHSYQGYLYGRPVPLADFEQLFSAPHVSTAHCRLA